MKLRYLTLYFLAACLAYPQTAVFPNGVANTPQLMQAGNNLGTRLTSPITSSATTIFVQNTTGFAANMLITFSDTNEIAVICQVNSFLQITIGYNGACPSATGRGFDNTAAAAHITGTQVFGYYTAWHHNVENKEVTAIESAIPNTVSDIAYSSFAAACGAAGTRTVNISKQWTALTTQTCGAALAFVGGGIIQPASGQTVTFTAQNAPLAMLCDISLGGSCNILPTDGSLHPEWWGMLANGQLGPSAHDDSAAFQAAVNESKVMGYAVSLPPGIIKITQPIQIQQVSSCNFQIAGSPPVATGGNTQICGIDIRGQGIGKTYIWQSQANTDAIDAQAIVAQFPAIIIESLSIYGPDGGTCPGTSGTGVNVVGSQKVTLRDLYVMGFCGPGKYGVTLNGPEDFNIDRVRIDYSDIGIFLTGAANAGEMNNYEASANWSAGLSISNTVSGTFNQVTIQGTHCDGLRLQNVAGLSFHSLYFEANNKTGRCYALNGISGVKSNRFDPILLNDIPQVLFLNGGPAFADQTYGNEFFSVEGVNGNQGQIIINSPYAVGNYWTNFLLPTVYPSFGGAFTNSTTATAGSASLSLGVTSQRPIYVGQTVSGPGIQSGTTVSTVAGSTGGGYTIGISLATTAPLASGTVLFGGAGGTSHEIFSGIVPVSQIIPGANGQCLTTLAGVPNWGVCSTAIPPTEFIPIVVFGDGNTPNGCTPTTPGGLPGQNTGTYLNAGGVFAVNIFVTLASKGTCTGVASITGMPVSVSNSTGTMWAGNLAISRTGLTPTINGGSGSVYLWVDNGLSGQLSDTDFTNTTVLRLTMSYLAP